ncbi:MAG TPA: tetratricopeptide repeat protein, partial [Pricia sp.]|nr:tetratricopeptide repeat protein [Pricia sp.]
MFEKSFLPLLLVTLLCISCDTKKVQSAEDFNRQEIDSVYSLIALGRDMDLNPRERNSYLEKAWALADTIENDSLKTKVFSRLSLAYLRLPDSLKFRKTNRETRELALKADDSIVLAEAHWDLAEFYKNESVADSSYYHFSQAKNLYEALDMENETGTMLNNMAIVQEDIKDYTGSEITTIQAIEILKPLKNYVQLFHSYNNQGAVTANLKEYERSLEYYQEALEYQEKIPFENNLDLYIKNNIGVVYQERGQYRESIPYFQEI